ncbi:MAG TPA: hypothetical protein VEA60_01040 [Allosphingosinicella sp.]|nr:hypothetical protein [Allosphingosinicella sp.]
MVRTLFPCAAALLLVACGGREDGAEPRANSQAELENRLDKLADRTSEDIEPPDRLGDLLQSDVGPELRARPACRLSRNGRLILVVNDAGAVARIDGRRVPLAVSGPVGPTGAFLSAPGVTVSVGRIEPPVGAADEHARPWPARVTIGGDRERPLEKHEASWICLR